MEIIRILVGVVWCDSN